MCDRPTRLRKAILGMNAFDDTAPEVTAEDVKQCWSLLGESGYTAYDIIRIANGRDIQKDVFDNLMKLLHSHL